MYFNLNKGLDVFDFFVGVNVESLKVVSVGDSDFHDDNSAEELYTNAKKYSFIII